MLSKKKLSSGAKGLVAGFIGGMAGAAVKATIEAILPVREKDEKPAQVKIVNELSTQLTGSKIAEENDEITEQLVNLPFGGSLGATYGYGKRKKDKFNVSDGVILGASIWGGMHEGILPAAKVKKSPKEESVSHQFNELIAHVAFGITCEFVRSQVAKSLKD